MDNFLLACIGIFLAKKLQEAAGNGADATLYVDDVFSTWLYTGTDAAQTITNGIDLAGKGGLVWGKSRSGAQNHRLYDTARGSSYSLISNDTAAQSNQGTNACAFNSNGFSLSAASGIVGSAGFGGPNYVSWTFREAAKFFDVQTITHTNGTANNIDLSVLGTVGMVIAKITTTTGDWTVWQRSLTASNNLKLNTRAAQSTTDAWLSVSGTTATLSASAPTGTYVIYGYAHDTSSTGIIQCGSFTTSADVASEANVNLGWEPQYVLLKSYSGGISNWYIFDTMRGWTMSTGDAKLFADTPDAETTATQYGNPTATGFYARALGANQTYCYMAIRRPNKPPTTGTQVFSPIYSAAVANTVLTTSFPVDLQIPAYTGATIGRFVVDRLRGVVTTPVDSATSPWIKTNLTDAETTGFNITRAWDNTGYQIPQYLGYATTVYFNFRRATGFFDVVAYTGSGATPPVTHNLGVVPELIIQKNRDGGAFGNWFAFNATQYLVLNLNNAATAYSSSITSTTFQPVSQSGGTNYVAYLFATLAGISKVGSYTGNGTGQAIACGFGSGGARFVLIKRTDSTGDWYTFDSARGLTSGSSPYLLLNSTAAEVTGNNGVYASSGGFTLGATALLTTNIMGASYIFLSVA
jgi:hypothetical protein